MAKATQMGLPAALGIEITWVERWSSKATGRRLDTCQLNEALKNALCLPGGTTLVTANLPIAE